MRCILLLALLTLSACGFKPSSVVPIGKVTLPFTVLAQDPYSGLADNIERSLTASGARLAQPGEPSISIVINNEVSKTNPLALNQFAQVVEYVTSYQVTYSLNNELGQVLIDKQVVEFRREFTFDENSSEGSPAELALLKREMQADMVRSIIRRSAIVLQAPKQ
jgi:LPS-assembly lipoprotein